MTKIRTCEKHDLDFDEDEGCEYCYNEYLREKNLIENFLEDVERIKKNLRNEYFLKEIIKELRKKWEAKLK